jgi:regulator of cell morphogenesis and NO signaling
MIKRLEGHAGRPALTGVGGVRDALGVLEREHDATGWALARIRSLTGGFSPPADACRGYRLLLAGLARLEADMRQHIHRENSVLFPGAVAVEDAIPGGRGAGRAARR